MRRAVLDQAGAPAVVRRRRSATRSEGAPLVLLKPYDELVDVPTTFTTDGGLAEAEALEMELEAACCRWWSPFISWLVYGP